MLAFPDQLADAVTASARLGAGPAIYVTAIRSRRRHRLTPRYEGIARYGVLRSAASAGRFCLVLADGWRSSPGIERVPVPPLHRCPGCRSPSPSHCVRDAAGVRPVPHRPGGRLVANTLSELFRQPGGDVPSGSAESSDALYAIRAEHDRRGG